jgi:hypothetical protein
MRRVALLSALGMLASLTTGERVVAQSSTACNPRVDFAPRSSSPVALLHPASVEKRYAALIAGRQWLLAFGSLKNDVDATFASLDSAGTPQFETIAADLRAVIDSTVGALATILDLPLSQRAAALFPLNIGQYEPMMPPAGGDRVILRAARPPGVRIPLGTLKVEEYEAVCWASRSFGRLLNGANFETIPAALARVTALATEWERYRADGPVQLPHELVVNSVLRTFAWASGDARFHPPRADLVLLHPFAGFEIARRDRGLEKHETFAVEVTGLTVWLRDWKQHVGASWVLAYDPQGRVGHGPLVRFSGYVTTGMIWREDASGIRRRTLLVTADVLKLLHLDAAALAGQQAKGVAGRIMAGANLVGR